MTESLAYVEPFVFFSEPRRLTHQLLAAYAYDRWAV
jgi:hypothetical protein